MRPRSETGSWRCASGSRGRTPARTTRTLRWRSRRLPSGGRPAPRATAAEPGGAPERLATWLELFKRGEGHPARGGWAEPYGITVTPGEQGHVVLQFETSEKHHQPNGVVQGGVLTAIADAAMGMAGMTVQEIGWANTTIELKFNFIRPVIRGQVKPEGRVVKAGRTVIFLESTVLNAEGKVAAVATSSVLVFQMPPREHPRAE